MGHLLHRGGVHAFKLLGAYAVFEPYTVILILPTIYGQCEA